MPRADRSDQTSRKAAAAPSPWAALRRRGWLLWCVTFLLLLALTATVPLLYWALLESLHDPGSNRAQSYLAIVGLTGLVLLFCLYTALKQYELERTSVALAREEREKDDIRA